MGDMDTATDLGMQMWFYNGIRVTLWIKEWTTTTYTQYILTLVVLVVFSIAHEGLACYRSNYMSKLSHKRAQNGDGASVSSRYRARVSAANKLALASLYFLNMVSSYLLMLAIMTYNLGCCLAVPFGMMLGYLLFFDLAPSSSSATASSALVHSDSCCAVRLLDDA